MATDRQDRRGNARRGTIDVNDLDGPLDVSGGGTGVATFTDGAVLLGSGTDAFTPLVVTTDGAILIGDGATDPTVLNAFSSATGTLKVANGGSGQSSYTNGQLLIGNTTGNTLGKATITAGTGITVTNGASSITVALTGGDTGVATLNFGTPTEITIAGGVVSVTRTYHSINGQGDAADDLDTINGGADGDLLILRAHALANDITLKDGTGNLSIAGDCVLDHRRDTITLLYDDTLSEWLELSRSENGA